MSTSKQMSDTINFKINGKVLGKIEDISTEVNKLQWQCFLNITPDWSIEIKNNLAKPNFSFIDDLFNKMFNVQTNCASIEYNANILKWSSKLNVSSKEALKQIRQVYNFMQQEELPLVFELYLMTKNQRIEESRNTG